MCPQDPHGLMWVGGSRLPVQEKCLPVPPGVAAVLSVLIRTSFLGAASLCHKLGTVQPSASRVIFFGFRKSSFTRRRQEAPHFFPPGNCLGSEPVLVSLRKTYLCVYTPQFSRVTFIKVNWHHKIKAGSKRQRSQCQIGPGWGAGRVTGSCGGSTT